MLARLQNKIAHFACLVALGVSLAGCVHRSALAPVPPRWIGATITKQDAAADLDSLFTTLEQRLPTLYAVRSREDVLAARRRLVTGLVERVGRADLWTRIAPLLASLGDHRIRIHQPTEEVTRRLNTGELYFPFRVSAATDSAGALRLMRGSERIIEINGQAAEDLLFRFTQLYGGATPRARAEQAAVAFGDLLMIHGVPAPFEVRLAGTDGTEHTELAPGIPCTSTISDPVAAWRGSFRLANSLLAASITSHNPPAESPRTCRMNR